MIVVSLCRCWQMLSTRRWCCSPGPSCDMAGMLAAVQHMQNYL